MKKIRTFVCFLIFLQRIIPPPYPDEGSFHGHILGALQYPLLLLCWFMNIPDSRLVSLNIHAEGKTKECKQMQKYAISKM